MIGPAHGQRSERRSSPRARPWRSCSQAPLQLVFGLGLTIMTLWLGLGWTPSVSAADSAIPLPAIPAASKGDQCVEPLDVIRRKHMEMLEHERDDTVYGGIRGRKHSLAGCLGCHTQSDATGAPIPINAPGQFCSSCHSYAAVTIDCFSCHATVPEAQAKDVKRQSAKVAAGAHAKGPGISWKLAARFLEGHR